MNNNTPIKMTEDEAILLVPWYLTGQLSVAKTLEFDLLLEKSQKLRECLKSENEVTNLVKEELPYLTATSQKSTEKRLENVFKLIDLETSEHDKIIKEPVNSHQSWFEKLFPSSLINIHYASYAAVSILSIALLFAFISPLVINNNVYYPATIETEANQKTKNVTIFLVGLSTEENDPKLLNLLEKMDAEMDSIPGKDGMFRIRYTKKLDANQTKKSLEILSAHKDLMWFVGEDY